MIVSIVTPHTKRSGNSVSSILLAMALGDLKRKVLLSHVSSRSLAFDHYLGLKAYEDKTSTPSQLVKLMREGAIKPEEIGDYCKTIDDYLDVFTNKETNFIQEDMDTLIGFLTESDISYEYLLLDIDMSLDSRNTEMALNRSNIVILNLTADMVELDAFNEMKERVAKMCKGKKVIILCSAYDSKAFKSTKDIAKYIGMDTSVFVVRHNSWVKWACNNGKLHYLYKQGKMKDADVLEVYKDVTSLASGVAKAKVAIRKATKGAVK